MATTAVAAAASLPSSFTCGTETGLSGSSLLWLHWRHRVHVLNRFSWLFGGFIVQVYKTECTEKVQLADRGDKQTKTTDPTEFGSDTMKDLKELLDL